MNAAQATLLADAERNLKRLKVAGYIIQLADGTQVQAGEIDLPKTAMRPKLVPSGFWPEYLAPYVGPLLRGEADTAEIPLPKIEGMKIGHLQTAAAHALKIGFAGRDCWRATRVTEKSELHVMVWQA